MRVYTESHYAMHTMLEVREALAVSAAPSSGECLAGAHLALTWCRFKCSVLFRSASIERTPGSYCKAGMHALAGWVAGRS